MGRLVSFCSSTGKNTGGIDCDVQLDALIFMLIGSAKITPSEQATEATFKAALIDRINRPNGDPEKLYPWFVANDVAKTTESDTVETAADGTKRTLRVAPPSYDITSWNVGLNQEAAMLAFNNTTIPVIGFDKAFQVAGKHDSDGNFMGAKAKIYTSGQGFASFQNGPATKTSVTYIDPFALSVNAKVYELTSFDADDFEGLLDATLVKVAVSSSNTHHIGAFIDNISIGKQSDLYDLYDDELASTTLWLGLNASNAWVAPSTAVKDTANEGWTLAFAVAVTKVKMADPDVLYAAGVKGIESIEVAV